MYIFLCEDSVDGIFTGVYDAWASHYGHRNISLTTRTPDNYTLFDEYISVTPDAEKSHKVGNTLLQRLGANVYSQICEAASALEEPSRKSNQLSKADAIYRTIVLGLSLKDGRHVLEYLGEPYVNRVFQLSRATSNEAHHLLGFLRFQELENGVLFARIHPKNDVLPLLGDHFSDRLPEENFMIYDETRKKAALHRKGSYFFLTGTEGLNEEMLHRFSSEELEYQRLWCGFFESIAIEARRNPKLQNQNIPKRFQKDAVEFSSNSYN
ncbi:TIGR03915 family putative DNA repair protein [Roseburia sp. 499]|uniref:TIGR03915 family putative DNA repair protein n=1 Tax=Roseburia sp. 499 TaxID=1261634 RepID=UPI000951512D|nr:TIGR03915 family putative DNA repair protein [Roseburia sp. 499]WVK69641.1 TIGR03915 family putative DNA repair protein [Roseburia sp. 499]